MKYKLFALVILEVYKYCLHASKILTQKESCIIVLNWKVIERYKNECSINH